ncbi:hypothetical protein FS749_000746 [Ceratobasidium sp. UAMH 11750]|nr:hypothetical protein FS749_000746 [Ceratobasidium sp. UAMH 11750]
MPSTRLTQAQPAARYESPPQPEKPSVPPARRQSTSVSTIRRNTPDDFPSRRAAQARDPSPTAKGFVVLGPPQRQACPKGQEPRRRTR